MTFELMPAILKPNRPWMRLDLMLEQNGWLIGVPQIER